MIDIPAARAKAVLADAIKRQFGPYFGTPEQIAKHGDRIESRQRKSANSYADACLDALTAAGLEVRAVSASAASEAVSHIVKLLRNCAGTAGQEPIFDEAADLLAEQAAALQAAERERDEFHELLDAEIVLRRNETDRLLKRAEAAEARAKRAEETLRRIAKPTHGAELSDTDAERADAHWHTITVLQTIARAALAQSEDGQPTDPVARLKED